MPAAADSPVSASPAATAEMDRAFDVLAEALAAVHGCLAEGSYDGLAEAVGLEHLDVNGVEIRTTAIVDAAETLFADAEDVWLFVLRVLEQTASKQHARFRCTGCLIWSPQGEWIDFDVEFDLCADLSRGADGEWRLERVAVGEATPEVIPFPDEPASELNGKPPPGSSP